MLLFTGHRLAKPTTIIQWQPTIYSHAFNPTLLALERYPFSQRRTLSSGFRNAIQASASGEAVLVFATITHDDLADIIRVVSEDQGGVSYLNGEIVNYKLDGNLYRGCPFLVELLTDEDRPPRGQVSVPDIDRTIGQALLALDSSPTLKIEIYKLSDFSETVDSDNARTPTGTPTREYVADYLSLRNVSADTVVQAELESFNLDGEPWPYLRATSDRCPALYADFET